MEHQANIKIQAFNASTSQTTQHLKVQKTPIFSFIISFIRIGNTSEDEPRIILRRVSMRRGVTTAAETGAGMEGSLRRYRLAHEPN